VLSRGAARRARIFLICLPLQLSFGERNSRRKSSLAFLCQPGVSEATDCELSHPVMVGTPIRALYRGGPTWYDGVVSRVHSDNTYDIMYSDGDTYVRFVRLVTRRADRNIVCLWRVVDDVAVSRMSSSRSSKISSVIRLLAVKSSRLKSTLRAA
jgi:hypothetical protein